MGSTDSGTNLVRNGFHWRRYRDSPLTHSTPTSILTRLKTPTHLMKQSPFKRRAVGIGLACASSLLPALRAEQSGNFTYKLINSGTEVEITDYSTTATC